MVNGNSFYRPAGRANTMVITVARSLLLLSALVCCFTTCRGGAEPSSAVDTILALKMENGETINSLAFDGATNIILLQRPEECLSCSVDFFKWKELAQSARGTFTVILTAQPSAAENREFQLLRLRFKVVDQSSMPSAIKINPAIAVVRRNSAILISHNVLERNRKLLLDSARKQLAKVQ